MKTCLTCLALLTLSTAEVLQFETTVQMVQNEGYKIENYYITTLDGYILNFHRIPFGKTNTRNRSKVIYLQHGLFLSSSDWVLMGPGKALAYLLADDGYDVWMGNFRGNLYSRNHTYLNPNADSFWKFSWHELGLYDIPAGIDYILQTTGEEKLYYVGHAVSASAFYIMASEKQEYMDKIQLYVHLSPFASIANIITPVWKLAGYFNKQLELFFNLINKHEFIPSTPSWYQPALTICSTEVGGFFCEAQIFLVSGFSPANMNRALLPQIMAHAMSGCATQQVIHTAQLAHSGYFRQYDYGPIRNVFKYGKVNPPNYDLSKVTAPGYLFYGANDWVASVKDVELLASKLPNLIAKILIDDTKFNHIDPLYSVNATRLLYPQILKLFANNQT